MKTEEAIGWGLRIGGSLPYLGYYFSTIKSDIEKQMNEPYHKAVRVVMIPLAEWKRLKKLDSNDL